MYIFWNILFWISLVAVVGLIGVFLSKILSRNAQAREYIADANNGGNYEQLAERSESTSAELLEKLRTVDRRLAAIEKTLTDIP